MGNESNESNAARILFTDLTRLATQLQLPDSVVSDGVSAAKGLPLKIPGTLLDRITRGNPNDPVLLQFLPRNNELLAVPGFMRDPLAESQQAPSGVLQKYDYRALVLTTSSCLAQCRYCFRRHCKQANCLFPVPVGQSVEDRLTSIFAPIRENRSIREIILSGGDPLAVQLDDFKKLLYYIKTLPYVNRVRIHTRAPILAPQYFDASWTDFFTRWSASTQKNRFQSLFMVFQINHPQEINDQVIALFERLARCNIVLLSQSVLLRGVNDSADVLFELFEKLSFYHVLPYYLHQLDRVEGAADFEVNEETGRRIIGELRRRLPGYAVPRYVREIAGEPNKVVLE
ncbi:MAG: KamA family radical SAM protein [Thermoguttaceae bacterium]|nr:KamA family radical SAM protein [Thermoguttaceae bacterium]